MAQEGYTAPFVLQDILTQKRAAQHQKLVDSLNLVQAQAEMENAAKRQAQEEEEARTTAAYRTKTLTEQAADRASREKIAAMPQREQPEQPMFTVGPTGKITPAIDPTGKPIMTRGANPLLELGFPPQPSAAGGPQLYQVPDPVTGTVESHWLKPGEQPSERSKISGLAIRKGNEPITSQAGGPSPAEFNKLAELRGKATTGAPRMFGMRAGKEPDPKAVAAYQQQRDNIITRYKASPAIVDAVMNALEEDPSVPVSEIISDVEASGATPEELAKFKEMLTIAGRR